VEGEANSAQGSVELRFRSSGDVAAVFHVRSGDGETGPWTYTVDAGDGVSDTFGNNAAPAYDLSVFGPNGFLRTFVNGLTAGSPILTVKSNYDRRSGGIELEIRNHGSNVEKVTILDAYSGDTTTHWVPPHDTYSHFRDLNKTYGWYDFTVQVESAASFQRRLAGHVETGRDSITDPAIAATLPLV
jgi:phospholipase C